MAVDSNETISPLAEGARETRPAKLWSTPAMLREKADEVCNSLSKSSKGVVDVLGVE